jgi:hypothetical protein
MVLAFLILMLYTESGNMLIMTYAYARASGDGSLISRYVRTAYAPLDYL